MYPTALLLRDRSAIVKKLGRGGLLLRGVMRAGRASDTPG
jgi:hypothetical protein